MAHPKLPVMVLDHVVLVSFLVVHPSQEMPYLQELVLYRKEWVHGRALHDHLDRLGDRDWEWEPGLGAFPAHQAT